MPTIYSTAFNSYSNFPRQQPVQSRERPVQPTESEDKPKKDPKPSEERIHLAIPRLSRHHSHPSLEKMPKIQETKPKSSSAPVTPIDKHIPHSSFQLLSAKQHYGQNPVSLKDTTKLASLVEVIDHELEDDEDVIIGEHLGINGVPTGLLFKKPCHIKVDFVNQTTVKVTRVIKEGLFWDTIEEYLVDVPKKNADVWIRTDGDIGVTKLQDETGVFSLDSKKDAEGNFIGYALQLQHFDGITTETGLLFKSGFVKVEYLNKKQGKAKVTQIIPGLLTSTTKTYYINVPNPNERLWIMC